jgi:hypothetical protein
MTTEINNHKLLKDRVLQYQDEGEFYMVLILKRRKDTKGKMKEGVNEDNRLIKHYFVYDKEYLERKMDSIIALCQQNNARAYVLVQRRSCRQVLWGLHDIVSQTLKSGAMNVHFDHLIRSCVAGMHEVPSDRKYYKRWVIDIDADSADVKAVVEEWGNSLGCVMGVKDLCNHIAGRLRNALTDITVSLPSSLEEIKKFMPKLSHIYCETDIPIVPTPHGYHIVTPPFNREKKMLDEYMGGELIKQDWIKPDALTLLYAPSLED